MIEYQGVFKHYTVNSGVNCTSATKTKLKHLKLRMLSSLIAKFASLLFEKKKNTRHWPAKCIFADDTLITCTVHLKLFLFNASVIS